MELREKIAAEIACRCYEYRPHEDSRTIADAILSIPEIAEALEVAKRAGELPRGKEAW